MFNIITNQRNENQNHSRLIYTHQIGKRFKGLLNPKVGQNVTGVKNDTPSLANSLTLYTHPHDPVFPLLGICSGLETLVCNYTRMDENDVYTAWFNNQKGAVQACIGSIMHT